MLGKSFAVTTAASNVSPARRVGLCTLFAVTACVQPCPPATTTLKASPQTAALEQVRIALIGTSDVHGYVEGHTVMARDRAGQVHAVRCGGLALLGGYLDNLRARMPVLLLDGGDMFQGTLVSNIGEGQAVVEAYNVLGYQAVAIGNHEFDYGPVGPRAVPGPDGKDDPTGALKARAAAAKFPFLSANLLDKKTGQPVRWPNVHPSVKLNVAGIPIGIVGAITEDTPHTTNALNLRDVTIAPVLPAVRAEALALRKKGVAAVILTIHEGANCQSFDDPRDLRPCQNSDERILSLVRALDGVVDAVVAGHTHAGVAHFVGDVPIVQAFSYGHAFGRIDLTFRRLSGGAWRIDRTASHIYPPTELSEVKLPPAVRTVLSAQLDAVTGGAAATGAVPPATKPPAPRCDPRVLDDTDLYPAEYEGRPVVLNAAVEAALRPHVERATARANSQLGIMLADRVRRNFRNESPLAQLMADLLRSGASRVLGRSVDIAVQNGGGIRNDLPPGPLTYGQVYEVQPFDNRLATLNLTGAQITEVFRRNLDGGHGVLVPSGIRVEARCERDGIHVTLRTDSGQPLDMTRTYTMAMSDFLASGGDNFAGVAPHEGSPQVTFYDDVLLRELIVEELTRYRGPLLDGKMQPPRLLLPGPRPIRCPPRL